MTLGQGVEAEQVRWLVRSDSGAIVARSRNLETDNVLAGLPLGETRGQRTAPGWPFANIPGESSSAAWLGPIDLARRRSRRSRRTIAG